MTTPPVFATFRFWNGATFIEPLIARNPDHTPQDLTGFAADFVCTREDTPQTILLHLTSADDEIVIDPLIGSVTLRIDSVQAATLSVDEDGEMWPFKLLLIKASDPTTLPPYVMRLVQGYVIASP